MKRTAINPSFWAQKFGFHSGEIIEGATRQLNVSGQGAMDAEGQPVHQDDMHAQFQYAMDNLVSVLKVADMTFIRILTTDTEATIANFDIFGKMMGPCGAKPTMTVYGITLEIVPFLRQAIWDRMIVQFTYRAKSCGVPSRRIVPLSFQKVRAESVMRPSAPA